MSAFLFFFFRPPQLFGVDTVGRDRCGDPDCARRGAKPPVSKDRKYRVRGPVAGPSNRGKGDPTSETKWNDGPQSWSKKSGPCGASTRETRFRKMKGPCGVEAQMERWKNKSSPAGPPAQKQRAVQKSGPCGASKQRKKVQKNEGALRGRGTDGTLKKKKVPAGPLGSRSPNEQRRNSRRKGASRAGGAGIREKLKTRGPAPSALSKTIFDRVEVDSVRTPKKG